MYFSVNMLKTIYHIFLNNACKFFWKWYNQNAWWVWQHYSFQVPSKISQLPTPFVYKYAKPHTVPVYQSMLLLRGTVVIQQNKQKKPSKAEMWIVLSSLEGWHLGLGNIFFGGGGRKNLREWYVKKWLLWKQSFHYSALLQ
jgi:hypothetical protein